MAKRKTIEIEALRVSVNEMLKESTCTPDVRLGMCSVLEQALHKSGNYHGFRHLQQEEVPYKQKAGIHFDKETRLILPYPDRFVNTDDTRRQYF